MEWSAVLLPHQRAKLAWRSDQRSVILRDFGEADVADGSNASGSAESACPSMSASPRKRRPVIKILSVVMGRILTLRGWLGPRRSNPRGLRSGRYCRLRLGGIAFTVSCPW